MSDSQLEVLYLKPGGTGWGPVDLLASLAARLLDGELTTLDDPGRASLSARAAALTPRRRAPGRRLLVIAASPALLAYCARRQYWWPGYSQIVAWVIDSFWTDRIPRFASIGRHFDHLFITDKDLVPEWASATKTPVHWLPWGSDVLSVDAEAVGVPRRVDVQRLGRQPRAWDNDERLVSMAKGFGLAARGRPPLARTGLENQRVVRQALLESKAVLAFHNLVSPAAYTHPSRSYVTARWTDALAAGATVVGAAPSNAPDILWDGATLEVSPDDIASGLGQVAEWLHNWSSAVAMQQHREARRRLDWRLRLAELSAVAGWGQTITLQTELAQLR